MEQQHPSQLALEQLKDTEFDLAYSDEDIRGRKVVDQNGTDIGHVSALFIDVGERKVRMLEIRTGGALGIGARHFLLPAETITHVAVDEVQVRETHERVAGSPVYDPTLVVAPTRAEWAPCYGYYGLTPYSDVGMYPGSPVLHDKATGGD